MEEPSTHEAWKKNWLHFLLATRPILGADYCGVGLPLASAGKRLSALAVSLLVAGTLCYQAGRICLADHRNRSSKPTDWLRAAQLEPGYGAYWQHLGSYRQWDFEAADLKLALQYYRRAVQTNPRSDLYWMDLASTYEALGEIPLAREAFEKARAAHPISAEVEWNYGNFLLRLEQFSEGFSEIRRAVLADPQLTPLAISRCWQSSQDVNRLLDEVLPNKPDAVFQAINYFASTHQLDPGLAAWNRLLARGNTFPLRRAFPLLDELLQQERIEDAKRVWRQALAAARVPFEESPDHSVIWNGGFEHDFAGGGFGWRQNGVTGAAIDFDSATFHSGSRSLRIDFEGGSNLDFSHVYEIVPVKPNIRYHFLAYLRTDSISTESGIRFFLYDYHHPEAAQVLTKDLTGTQPWTPVEADLTTGPETRVLNVQLRRLPSRVFDNKLSGTVWVDDVSLAPVGQAAESNSP